MPPQSSSPYPFPSIQQHQNSISSTASPSLPSLTSPSAFNSTGAGQPTQQPPPSSSHRLQPLNSWLPPHQQGPPPPP
jgi:hypothetical protein